MAIAKGDVPQEAWFRLGRTHTLSRGEHILLSWTGTMFEYLMPVLWMRHYPGTITERSVRAAIRAQRDYGRRKGVPWGISESACLGASADHFGYGPFGIPELALKRIPDSVVVSPYSSFLAASLDPAAVVAKPTPDGRVSVGPAATVTTKPLSTRGPGRSRFEPGWPIIKA